jgi:5-methylcytosine-specific restriction endonuclease McrA
MTGAQLDRFARAHRRVSRADDEQARDARRVTWRVDDQDGSVAMTVRLPAVPGQVLIQALRAAAHDLDHPHHPGHDISPARTDQSASAPAGNDAPAEAPASGTTQPATDVAANASSCPADRAAGPEAPPPPGLTAEEETRPGAQSLADALASIAADYLAGKITAADNPDIYQVIVHVGPEALTTTDDPVPAPGASAEAPATPAASPAPPAVDPAQAARASAEASATANLTAADAETHGGDPEDACRPDCPYRRVGHPAHPSRCHLEDGPALSYATAQRIACTATVSWMLHDHDGTLLDIGRRHRKPTAAQRRAVRERDGYRCAFPGCQSRRTDLHHIRHWARGGTTSYWNLICLCEAHHVIVHEAGYLITRDDHGGFTFTRPGGTVMPASPELPAPTAGDITTRHDAPITPDTIQTAAGERMNLHLTIWAAFANARINRKRAA